MCVKIDPLQHSDHIAGFLAQKFVRPLYDSCNEKGFFVYVACFAGIFDWSHEFSCQYGHKMNDWEEFETSDKNIYSAASRSDFLIA